MHRGSEQRERKTTGGAAPLLRRLDQAAVASLVSLALVAMATYWFVHGGHRGELIEIDRAEPLTARYLVDINAAGWPDSTSLKILADMVFTAAELPVAPFDSRATPGIDRASQLLSKWLAIGPLPYREVMNRARKAGLSRMSFQRAKRRLGVTHGAGLWTLPGAVAV
jgi:hypothetical protein